MSKWDSCLFMSNTDMIINFFQNKENNLFILGKGFDPRTCRILEVLLKADIQIEAWMLDYNDTFVSEKNTKKNVPRSMRNYEQFCELSKNIKNQLIKAPTYNMSEGKRNLIISESIRARFNKANVGMFSNIIIDISAMPRPVSFCLIRRLYEICGKEQKLYIMVCENSKCDENICPVIEDGSAEYLHGFNTFSMTMESDEDDTIWLPALGANALGAFNIIADYLKPIEICPIVPFPSVDVKRSEQILRNYGNVLFRERLVEKRNIIYVPENHPGIVYNKLYSTVKYYEKALNNSGERRIRYAFSSQSSKLIDIGILMTIMSLVEDGIKTGMVTVENRGYDYQGTYNYDSEMIYCVCLNDCEFDW